MQEQPGTNRPFRRFALAVGLEEIAAVEVHAEDQENPSNP
tara:strand:- start:872 stop:991 length:120 start_codon:yes stop_codon:yes gene_type:complete